MRAVAQVFQWLGIKARQAFGSTSCTRRQLATSGRLAMDGRRPACTTLSGIRRTAAPFLPELLETCCKASHVGCLPPTSRACSNTFPVGRGTPMPSSQAIGWARAQGPIEGCRASLKLLRALVGASLARSYPAQERELSPRGAYQTADCSIARTRDALPWYVVQYVKLHHFEGSPNWIPVSLAAA